MFLLQKVKNIKVCSIRGCKAVAFTASDFYFLLYFTTNLKSVKGKKIIFFEKRNIDCIVKRC